MLNNTVTAVFGLALIVGVAAFVLLLLSFVVRRIPRRPVLYTLAGSATAAFIAIVIGAATMPPTTAAQSIGRSVDAPATLAPRRTYAPARHRPSPQPTSGIYSGEPAAKLARKYNLSPSDVTAITQVQRICTAAHADDEQTRAEKDSMGVAMALERVADEWDDCDTAVQRIIADRRAIHGLDDYDYIAMFGVIRSHPLLEESGAYGSAGTEWQQFGQQERAIKDLRNAVDVGRKMVGRGYTDEGNAVISDNAGALHDAEDESSQ